ncbi:MAG: FkbM family methyltransferase, partial [Flavobacteriaceae bacterium]
REIGTVDLIKLDTEGTEMDILRAGNLIIDAHRPLVICEMLYDVIEAELEKFFGERDYHFYVHMPNGLKRVNTLQRSSDDGIRNCFFVPSEKRELVKAYVVNSVPI